ncbi:hypothetical protein AB7281_23395 [Providencia rettgeri]
MPLLFAWIPALVSAIFSAWRIYVVASIVWKAVKLLAGFAITYAVFSYVFSGFISGLINWINSSITEIAPIIDMFSLFLPSNFETCFNIIVSIYILSLVLSWKHKLAMALGAF